MKLDRFINRPVLSTVISILIVILGAIGLATLPITQYPDIAPLLSFFRWQIKRSAKSPASSESPLIHQIGLGSG